MAGDLRSAATYFLSVCPSFSCSICRSLYLMKLRLNETICNIVVLHRTVLFYPSLLASICPLYTSLFPLHTPQSPLNTLLHTAHTGGNTLFGRAMDARLANHPVSPDLHLTHSPVHEALQQFASRILRPVWHRAIAAPPSKKVRAGVLLTVMEKRREERRGKG